MRLYKLKYKPTGLYYIDYTYVVKGGQVAYVPVFHKKSRYVDISGVNLLLEWVYDHKLDLDIKDLDLETYYQSEPELIKSGRTFETIKRRIEAKKILEKLKG